MNFTNKILDLYYIKMNPQTTIQFRQNKFYELIFSKAKLNKLVYFQYNSTELDHCTS